MKKVRIEGQRGYLIPIKDCIIKHIKGKNYIFVVIEEPKVEQIKIKVI